MNYCAGRVFHSIGKEHDLLTVCKIAVCNNHCRIGILLLKGFNNLLLSCLFFRNKRLERLKISKRCILDKINIALVVGAVFIEGAVVLESPALRHSKFVIESFKRLSVDHLFGKLIVVLLRIAVSVILNITLCVGNVNSDFALVVNFRITLCIGNKRTFNAVDFSHKIFITAGCKQQRNH